MKNIHILPTDKPSRLHFTEFFEELVFTPKYEKLDGVNIYITSDEEIKEGDWLFSTKTNNLFKADSIEYLESHNMIEDFDKSFYINSKYAKKIILTTDQDLIKDGVQAIDDEFLEWFVENPSCEEVKVDLVPVNEFGSEITVNGYGFDKFRYKIIIPKEEPKEETLEEAADVYVKLDSKKTPLYWMFNDTFKAGAKWQAEKMYSEEEVLEILLKHQSDYRSAVRNTSPLNWSFDINKWFKQFKKK